MPIRLMTWNIRSFGYTVADRNSVLNAIARTIIRHDVDIFVLVELLQPEALNFLMDKLNELLAREDGGGPYPGRFFSVLSRTGTDNTPYVRHAEYYGVIVRDPAQVQTFGMSGPVGENEGLVNEPLMVNLEHLSSDSSYDGTRYTNILPLLRIRSERSRHLPRAAKENHSIGGRPPAFAGFQVNGRSFHLVICHLRPEERTAMEQMQALAATGLFQSDLPLIVTGDFNVEFERTLERGDDDSRARKINEIFSNLRCFMAFARGSTHVSNHLFDNFFIRGLSWAAAILPPGEVLETLSSDDLNELIYTQERKAGDAGASPDDPPYRENISALQCVQQLLREGAPLGSERPDVKTVFNLISDHCPIYVDLTV